MPDFRLFPGSQWSTLQSGPLAHGISGLLPSFCLFLGSQWPTSAPPNKAPTPLPVSKVDHFAKDVADFLGGFFGAAADPEVDDAHD